MKNLNTCFYPKEKMTNIYEKIQGGVEIVLQVLLADHFEQFVFIHSFWLENMLYPLTVQQK